MVGFINDEAVQELLSECVKMKSLNHLHVMTLKGVCLDGGPVPYIVLPYMANGSLLSYLKKERSSLTITVPVSTAENTVIGGEEEKQSDVSTICQIYKFNKILASSLLADVIAIKHLILMAQI